LDINSEETGFFELDRKLADLISRHVSSFTIPPIKEKETKPIHTEIHDELGAYFGFKILPAPAKRQRKKLRRRFSGLN